MAQTYWLSRKRSSLAMARKATSAEARLIHYHLAGSYSIKAAMSGLAATPPLDAGHQGGAAQ